MILSKTLLLGSVAAAVTFAQNTNSTIAATSNSTTLPMFPLSSDSEFAFTLEVMLSLANGGGAATGEVLRAASQIIPGNYESWYKEFKFLGDSLSAQADGIDSKRYPVSAREAYFRASSYYRIMDFFLHGNQSDVRVYESWPLQMRAFDKALALMEIPGVRYNLTANGFSVPTIFFPATQDKDCKRPTIVAGTGYDGSQEDLYHGIGKEALARGYNFVSYEGPGQPTVRRLQGKGFIREWWEVLTPVVDFLATRSDVDMNALGQIGESFGGTLAPLATVHENRFTATIAIDGLYNLRDQIERTLTAGGLGELVDLFNSGKQESFDQVMLSIQTNASYPTQLRWLIDQGKFAFATDSAFDWFTRFGEISLDNVTNQVKGPLFLGKGENDSGTGNQPDIAFSMLKNISTFYEFPTALGAGEHCQVGNEPMLSQVMYDWFAGVLERKDGKS